MSGVYEGSLTHPTFEAAAAHGAALLRNGFMVARRDFEIVEASHEP